MAMPATMQGMALRLVSSIGLTPAIFAQMMLTPATGDMQRPRLPAAWTTAPISEICRPNVAACGVTVPLKAKTAALPEPESAARIKGPKVADTLARAAELAMASISAFVKPITFMPWMNIAAAAIKQTMLAKPLPAPLKNELAKSRTLGRVTRKQSAVPRNMAFGMEMAGNTCTAGLARMRMMIGTSGTIA